MKYFLARIYEQNADYEYAHDFLLKARSKDSAEKKVNNLATTWYGNDGSVEEEGTFFNCGEVCTNPGAVIEIPEDTFRLLKQSHFQDLTVKV